MGIPRSVWIDRSSGPLLLTIAAHLCPLPTMGPWVPGKQQMEQQTLPSYLLMFLCDERGRAGSEHHLDPLTPDGLLDANHTPHIPLCPMGRQMPDA